MYHFLTNNHLTLLMPPKESLSQLGFKGDSTPHITTFLYLISLTTKYYNEQKKLENSVFTTSKINSHNSLDQCFSNFNMHTNDPGILSKYRFWFSRSWWGLRLGRLIGYQVMQVLLIHRPHLEDQTKAFSHDFPWEAKVISLTHINSHHMIIFFKKNKQKHC